MDLESDSYSFSSRKSPHLKIKKSTMSETYKFYNELLKNPSKEFENINEFISSDTSVPLFEERLCLMLMGSLHLESKVVKILLSQNDYQISKVLSFKWFFRNLSSELCIKELFPFISLSVRCKIINRLSKHLENTEEAQKYFEFVSNTYDNERAKYLLPRCSPEYILSFFEKTKPTFEHNNEVRILFNICKRYPELGLEILSHIFESKKESKCVLAKYKKILLYLSGNHPDLIVPFLKKYHLYMPSNTFGIKLTKKLGSKLKRDLLPDLMKSFIFKEKFLFPILNKEEQVKYLASVVIPDNKNLSFCNWKISKHRMSQLLKLIPVEKRLNMIQSVFKEVYNSNFSDHSKCWTSEILELLPTTTRKPFLEKLEVLLEKAEKTELDENIDTCSFSLEYPEKLIYLYDSRTAFEMFKKILRKCPAAARRESILTFMVKNCSINNDIRILQELVEFIATRHRNDDYNVISSFNNAISDHFPSTKLNSIIFEKLEELAYFTSLKGSSNDFYSRWKELHMHHRLNNNMEVDMKNFFQSVVLRSHGGESFLRYFDLKQSKTLVLAICNETMKWIQNKSSEKLDDSVRNHSEMLLRSLINTCKDFNRKNKSNKIFIKDIQGLEQTLKKKAEEKLADVGGRDWPLDVWEIMLNSRCYGDVFGSAYKQLYLSYIVKRNPESITKYLDEVLTCLLSGNFRRDKTFLASFIMAISFLGKTEKVKEKILNEFKNGFGAQKRKLALELYSHLCTIEEFSSAVEKYIPKQERVEQKQEDFDEIQIFIPSLLKNVKPRWKNLELVLKFYLGDFLISVLPAFSACCCYTRCDFVIPFLKEQLNAAPPKISYKKHIIRLIVELSDRKGRSDFYLKCWDEYEHYSVRSILMKFIAKSFLEQPSQESFQVLKKCILESDEITIESKPDSWKIPKEFFSAYICALWQFSEGREKYFRDNFQRELFWSFNRDNIDFLPTEFCETIIESGLFSSFSDNGIETFTVLFLSSKPETVERRVQFVLDLIKTRKPNSQNLFAFISILIAQSQNRPADFAEIFRIILENWPDYPLGVLFEERILLTYYSLHYKLFKKKSDLDEISVEFGKELKTFFSNIESFNDLAFIYAKVLKNFFKVLRTSRAVLVVKELVSELPNRSLAILAILSLPEETVVWHKMEGKTFNKNIIEGKKVLNEIFNAFECCNDKVVEIYLRSKFDFVKP